MEVQCAQVEGRQEGPGRWQEGPGNVGEDRVMVAAGLRGEPGPCRPPGELPLHLRKVGSQPLKSLSSEDRICGKGSIWPAGSAFHPESRPLTGRKGGQGGLPEGPADRPPMRSPRSASLRRLFPSDAGSDRFTPGCLPSRLWLSVLFLLFLFLLSLCFLSHSLHVYSSSLPPSLFQAPRPCSVTVPVNLSVPQLP